jgi:hypothetical protein
MTTDVCEKYGLRLCPYACAENSAMRCRISRWWAILFCFALASCAIY